MRRERKMVEEEREGRREKKGKTEGQWQGEGRERDMEDVRLVGGTGTGETDTGTRDTSHVGYHEKKIERGQYRTEVERGNGDIEDG